MRTSNTAGNPHLTFTFGGQPGDQPVAGDWNDAARRAGVRLAAALHTGECEIDGEAISGTTVQIGALLSEAAAAGDVLVSNTVRDLVAGSGIEFASRGQAFLGARLGEWSLFEVRSGR